MSPRNRNRLVIFMATLSFLSLGPGISRWLTAVLVVGFGVAVDYAAKAEPLRHPSRRNL